MVACSISVILIRSASLPTINFTGKKLALGCDNGQTLALGCANGQT
jgi:hypothetical protein